MVFHLSLEDSVLAALGIDLAALARSPHGRAIVDLLCGMNTTADLVDTSERVADLFDPPLYTAYESAIGRWAPARRFYGAQPAAFFSAWVAYTQALRATLALPSGTRLTWAITTPARVNVALRPHERDAFWKLVAGQECYKDELAKGRLCPGLYKALADLVDTHPRVDGLLEAVVTRRSQLPPNDTTRAFVLSALDAIERAWSKYTTGAAERPMVCIERAERWARPGAYLCAVRTLGALVFEAARGVPSQALATLGLQHPETPRELVVGTRWLVELLCSERAPLLVLGRGGCLPTQDGTARPSSQELVTLYLMLAAELGPAREAVRGFLVESFADVAEAMRTRPDTCFPAPGWKGHRLPKNDSFQPYVSLPACVPPDEVLGGASRCYVSAKHRAAARMYTGHVSLCAAAAASARLVDSLAQLTVPVTHWFYGGNGTFVALAKPTLAQPLALVRHASPVSLLRAAARLFNDMPARLREVRMPTGAFADGAVFDGCAVGTLCIDEQERLWLPAWALAPRSRPLAAVGYNAMDTFHAGLCLFQDLVSSTRTLLNAECAAVHAEMNSQDLARVAGEMDIPLFLQRLSLTTKTVRARLPPNTPLDVKARAAWIEMRLRAVAVLGPIVQQAGKLFQSRTVFSNARPLYEEVDRHTDAFFGAVSQTCIILADAVEYGAQRIDTSLPIWAAYDSAVSMWEDAKPRAPTALVLRDAGSDLELDAVPHFELPVCAADVTAF